MSRVDTVIVWVNYNSSKIRDIVLESLHSVAELDRDRWLLLVIDNGSSDGSFEEIKHFIECHPVLRNHTKIIRLGSNLGFTGANNIAWRYILERLPEAKYLVMLNNDAIVYRDSLSKLIEYIESMPHACGVQGIIELRDSGRVDSYGCYIDELLTVYPFMNRKKVGDVPKKCFAVTYVAGAYAIYRIEALKQIVLKHNSIFPTEAFAYLDDDLLGILAYARGMYMVAVPVRSAKHYVSLSFKATGLRNYFGLRNLITKSMLVGTRYKPISILHAIRATVKWAVKGQGKQRKILLRATVDGVKLAYIIERKYGLTLREDEVKRIPLIPISLVHGILSLLSYGPGSRSVMQFLEKYVATKYGIEC